MESFCHACTLPFALWHHVVKHLQLLELVVCVFNQDNNDPLVLDAETFVDV